MFDGMNRNHKNSFLLSELAQLLGGEAVNIERADPCVSAAVANSSGDCQGSLFVAIKGLRVDGHDFLDEAFARGAVAALVNDAARLGDRPGIVVLNGRKALSVLAALLAGEPSKRLKVVGMTGTNGKTTINWVLYHLLNHCGCPCLRVGSLGAAAEGVIDDPFPYTTPEPLILHDMLARAADADVKAAVVEVTSIGLHQYRVENLEFDLGMFTQLSRDHLDYHGDMEDYFQAKLRFFKLLADSPKPAKAAVINVDCEYGRRVAEFAAEQGLELITVGKRQGSTIQIVDFEQGVNGSILELSYQKKSYKLKSRYIGFFNGHNLAMVVAAAVALGHEIGKIVKVIPQLPLVPGRLEAVGNSEIGVFVDYAHTPDALKNVLWALRPITENNLWVIFGCGGDRDRGKRPEMALVAAELADHVVVTSDNPRSEDPQRIVDDILQSGINPLLVELDRRTAIRTVLRQAIKGDVVLIAGKGHEDYQLIGSQRLHFSDVEEAGLVLKEL